DRRDDRLIRRDEVVAAHARRARPPGGDHDDVRALGLVVAVRPDDRGLVAEHGAGLVHVERLALGEVRDDVDEDDVCVVAPRDLLGARRADVSGADDGDLVPSAPRLRQLDSPDLHQTRTPSLSMIASATWLVPTAAGSSRLGFMS